VNHEFRSLRCAQGDTASYGQSMSIVLYAAFP
jgi:hypothetical protein